MKTDEITPAVNNLSEHSLEFTHQELSIPTQTFPPQQNHPVHYVTDEQIPKRISQLRQSYKVAVISAEKIRMEPDAYFEDIRLNIIDAQSEITEQERRQIGVYFRDGKRKTDYVLSYVIADDALGEEENEEKRKMFELNLMKQGLELERENIPVLAGLDKVRFVKIHAPWEVLSKWGQEMMMRVPVKEREERRDTFMKRLKKSQPFHNPFKIANPHIPKEPKYVTAFFNASNVDLYLFDDKDKLFQKTDRSRMVYRILQLTPFAPEKTNFGIERMIYNGLYDGAYSLHDGSCFVQGEEAPENERQKLRLDWASFSKWYKYQPLDGVKNYFGTRVALYFAWLGTYNMCLVPAAIVGVLCFIYGVATMESFIPAKEICDEKNSKLFYMCPLCDTECSYWSLTTSCTYSKITHWFDSECTVFFAVFMSLWTTIFLEIWKRRQAVLSYEWDTIHFESEYEPPRPEFVAKVTDLKPNPVTGRIEPYMPRKVRLQRFSCAASVVAFMVCLAVATLLGVVIYRAGMVGVMNSSSNGQVREQAKMFTALTASVISLVGIFVLSVVYNRLAYFLTNWENPRTRTEFQDILTVKMYMFEFVNTYSSLFYIAFFKGPLIIGSPSKYTRINQGRLEGCDPSGCLIELCIQLAVIMVGKQLGGLVVKLGLPTLTKWWNRRGTSGNVSDDDPHSTDPTMPRWEAGYLLNPEPEFRMFYEYLEMVIQFGFVTMFVAAFPLAPFFALLNNVIELRVDAYNFVVNFRRPNAERAQDIGVWYKVLEILGMISILVNSFVIAFTSEFIPRTVYKYYYSPDGTLEGYVNNSLSYFNVSHLEPFTTPANPTQNLPYTKPICRFKEYLESDQPYYYNKQFFLVTTIRLIFVMVFQYFVYTTKHLLDWLIPDIPKSLDICMKREEFLARECFRRSEAEAAQDMMAEEDEENEEHSSETRSLYQSCQSLQQRGRNRSNLSLAS